MALVAVVLFGITGASGQRARDDFWNPEHIDHLPAEVRVAVLAKCPVMPTAAHYFATYFHDQINLHFELFHCESSKAGLCNRCLHQVYKLTSGHYGWPRASTDPETTNRHVRIWHFSDMPH
jgi:hypothetical protein